MGSRLLCVTIFVAVALVCGLTRLRTWLTDSAVGGAAPQASLSLANTVRDLGPVSDQKEWEIAFPVRNAGARRLVLNEVDLACDCGDPTLRTIVVQPRETVNLVVRLNSRSAVGPVENVASFTTNDKSCPRLNLTVRATVHATERSANPRANDRATVSLLNR